MIEGIDIANFGSFKGFTWNSVTPAGKPQVNFKTLNLLYGRNCSGKTTLSRIVRALETGELPENYLAPAFTVHLDGKTVTQADVGPKQNIRVYNRDFVERHLGFLRNAKGNIDSFTIASSENKKLGDDINSKTQQLGSVEGKAGLLYEHSVALDAHTTAQLAATTAAEALESLLFNKANSAPDGIKHKREFGVVNYDKRELKKDLAVVKAGGSPPLDDDLARNLAILVNEAQLPEVKLTVEFASNFPAIGASATDLLTRKIRPTQPIQELLNDAVLQSWVEMGMGLHRDKRDTCGFCHQPLPADLWSKLDAHFDAAAKALALEIRVCQQSIQQELDALTYVQRIPRDSVYAVHRDKLDKLNEALYEDVLRHQATLRVLSEELKIRSGSIFDSRPAPPTPNYANAIATTATAINEVVAASNATTASLSEQKAEARRRLLLNEVAKFAVDIGYEVNVTANQELDKKAVAQDEAVRELDRRVQLLQVEIEDLRNQQQDERLAASRVNDYLQKHFGQQGLRIVAEQPEGSPGITFRIYRGKEIAHNLSDGECSLVAFCYFLAKLEDPVTQGKKPIIWIDDPMSSLDSNHVFFLFSLIESQLARPTPDSATGANVFPYGQIFISTHNLEFLKYLRRLVSKTGEKAHLQHFVVAKRDTGSIIDRMPEYLVQYTTEFNFLFGELCICVDPANQPTHVHSFYNFGANLRRFLEVYLYFKFPFADGNPDYDFTRRIKMFFNGGVGDDSFITRMAHEGAHLMGAMDRAMLPVERDEISKAARMVLSAIRKADKEQYVALLSSIDESCPL